MVFGLSKGWCIFFYYFGTVLQSVVCLPFWFVLSVGFICTLTSVYGVALAWIFLIRACILGIYFTVWISYCDVLYDWGTWINISSVVGKHNAAHVYLKSLKKVEPGHILLRGFLKYIDFSAFLLLLFVSMLCNTKDLTQEGNSTGVVYVTSPSLSKFRIWTSDNLVTFLFNHPMYLYYFLSLSL